ncbi:sigma 54-interacting transcriptional regulator [Desulforhopalus singaporensis]
MLSAETGTGKEPIVRTIHISFRNDGPFIDVNWARLLKLSVRK